MIPTTELNRALDVARRLEAQGFFEKVRAGSQKAASLFARLAAIELNPDGDPDNFGCLSKAPGEIQVDGFAEDAIVFGNDPFDLANVVDLVQSAGVEGASVPSQLSVKPRRENNRWVKPQPLTQTQLLFLRPSGQPPTPPVPPSSPLPGRVEMMREGEFLHRYYMADEGLMRDHGLWINGAPDWEGIGAWLFDVYLAERMKGRSPAEARAAYVAQIRNSEEWRAKHPGQTP